MTKIEDKTYNMSEKGLVKINYTVSYAAALFSVLTVKEYPI